jgi:hypothetical protein
MHVTRHLLLNLPVRSQVYSSFYGIVVVVAAVVKLRASVRALLTWSRDVRRTKVIAEVTGPAANLLAENASHGGNHEPVDGRD